MMDIKAFIFDLDGVLVSTDELHYKAWKQLADRVDIYFDREINNRLRGVSRTESLNIILERSSKIYTPEEMRKMCDYKNQIYVGLLDGLSDKDILDGVCETLDILIDRGFKLAVGSSSKNAAKILRQTGLVNRFDSVADGNDITCSKPNPEVFLCAAQKLGLEAKQCAVVEDAVAGIEAAKSGGMYAVAIGDAQLSPLADHKLKNIRELCDTISI